MAEQKPPDSSPETGGQRAFKDEERAEVTQIHRRIVAREETEPEEGEEPPPWWLWATVAALLVFAGYYVGRYAGTFSVDAHELEQKAMSTGAGQQQEAPVKGDEIFSAVCQTCHQAGGTGVAGQYPPLAGSEWLLKDPETPVRIVLRGLEGPITVKGSGYSNKMPFFHDKLSDKEISAALSYVRSAWGNSAPAITPEAVAAIRKETEGRGPWTAAELEALRKRK
jgi:mono/diheme cytochrome c family protein